MSGYDRCLFLCSCFYNCCLEGQESVSDAPVAIRFAA
uniref:Uncharacterized protein n=1 Tax=Arundo donax TaxID=35708 RepID=A0A0A9BYX6_ARUDO